LAKNIFAAWQNIIDQWQSYAYNIAKRQNIYTREDNYLNTVDTNEVKKFMQENGFREPEMAAKMGISYTYLFRVLRGERKGGAKFITGLINVGMPKERMFANNALPKDKTEDPSYGRSPLPEGNKEVD
jgi:hypothetical protein